MKTTLVMLATVAAFGLVACDKKTKTVTETETTTTTTNPPVAPVIIRPAPVITPAPMPADPAASAPMDSQTTIKSSTKTK